MTARQPIGDIVPTELLIRLRAELEAARDARRAQLDEAPEMDDMAFAFREMHEKALGEVAAALERMDEGRYGVCDRCRAVISIARLEAVPQTRFCVSCAR